MTDSNDDKKVDFITLNAAGAGTIEATDAQQLRLDEFTERVGLGEFHRPTTGTIPVKCIDGRCGGHGPLMPNAAGGSETLMVADDLTAKKFTLQGELSQTGDQQKALLQFLVSEGYPVGGHTAVNLHGAPSGCGANDKLADIYKYIAQNGATLRSIATDVLGYNISDEEHELITQNAASRSEFTSGDQLLEALIEVGGTESVDTLRGEHTEVMAVINRRMGTTLDRDAIEAEFGDKYESFNVDEWSFKPGAEAISPGSDAEQVHHKRVAMLYYNLATAGVLCGPTMRVVVLS